MVIAGQWRGDFGMFYKTRHPRTGEWFRFDAEYSNVRFYSDYHGARSGWGKQVDVYRHGPYAQQYYSFNWTVRNRVLYLEYPHDPDLNVAIYDYYLDHTVFTGRMGDSNFNFKLFKLSNYNDWHLFTGNYSFSPYENWTWNSGSYTQKQNLGETGENTVPHPSVTTDAAPLRIVRGHKGNTYE